MRKQITGQELTGQEQQTATEAGWLDIEALAEVEVTSEAPGHPVENALLFSSERPWQAASPGRAAVTLRFDTPQRVSRMRLRFADPEHERSQEWALTDGTGRELLRQGWNFSPGGSTVQDETYTLNLSGVRSLTLTIDPDRGRDRYPATLAAWRIGTDRSISQ